ncbi:uncharacterized protein LOC106636263 isoform X2 [Copidosoma floridanum]|uniref:uncharacterized protein LOC106636263 isoform X2 n=1 Tax=Copidosoma floridanum TaxID=29053 RepID=UPI0006C9B832|nr:uncharacterized protein LOC106636263 isoform X2 [Copidosoma floridanum]
MGKKNKRSRTASTTTDMANASGVSDAATKQKRIVWVDMEMTGLDPETHKILEVACFITDENLKIISEEFHKVLHQPESELQKMDQWCQKVHTKSGLVKKVEESKITEKQVDEELLFFMMKYIPKGKCPMAGNSVYMDRLFLRKFMPSANDYMHYRIIDVSSIKEVVKRWKPEVYEQAPKKLGSHEAVEDIKLSIAELDYYRAHIFMNSNLIS